MRDDDSTSHPIATLTVETLSGRSMIMAEPFQMGRTQFAIRYGLDIDAMRNWEHGRRKPDTAARSYLRAISNDPKAVEAALWACPPAADRTAD